MTEIAGKDVILELHDLRIGYGKPVASIDWVLRSGEFWVIHGPNGCGKSTLLKTILGLISAVDGELAWKSNPGIGYIPQSVGIHPSVNLRVQDFISMGRDALHSSRKSFRMDWAGFLRRNKSGHNQNQFQDKPSRETAIVERLGLEDILKVNFWNLSGGQQRRAILARTLLVEPQLLLVDEPSSGLDRASASRFYEELDRLNKEEGKTILIVSHEDHYLESLSGLGRLEFRNGFFNPEKEMR
ncbi:MAG: ATP-binding cassette domain-containing protein [Leptospiraceae bacterium]